MSAWVEGNKDARFASRLHQPCHYRVITGNEGLNWTNDTVLLPLTHNIYCGQDNFALFPRAGCQVVIGRLQVIQSCPAIAISSSVVNIFIHSFIYYSSCMALHSRTCTNGQLGMEEEEEEEEEWKEEKKDKRRKRRRGRKEDNLHYTTYENKVRKLTKEKGREQNLQYFTLKLMKR